MAERSSPRTHCRLAQRWVRAGAVGGLVVLVTGYARPAATAPEDTTSAAETPSAAPSALQLPVERRTLDNGLRVVLSEDHSSPTISVAVTYDVGARNEEEGRSGFAHLFEHMMFQGSRNVAKGEHYRLISSRGGKLNGTTNPDRTNYFETLPASALDLALWLEADRMKTLAVNRKNFENQRAVVQEEYRMRYSNRPYRLGYFRLHQLVFQGYFPHEHPTIGYLEDLDNADFRWIRKFYDTYYAPNNAVLSIVGDFDPERTLQLVQYRFGSAIPNPNLPKFEEPERLPRQTSERFSVMTDTNAKTPGVYMGWRIPPSRTPDHYALELLAVILGQGDSSRLKEKLVFDRASAQRVSVWTADRRGPDLFGIHFVVSELSSVDKNQESIEETLTRLRLQGPSEQELEKAKTQLRSGLIRRLQSTRQRAVLLGEYELFWGDANLLTSDLERYDQVSVAQVQQAVKQYLGPSQRTIVEVYPPGWVKDEPPAILRRTHIVKPGENLIRIAKHYGSTVKDIAETNKINPKKPIFPGMKLTVPVANTAKARAARKPKFKIYTVKKGDVLSVIARRHGVTVKAISEANKISSKRPIMPGQELKIPPPNPKPRQTQPKK